MSNNGAFALGDPAPFLELPDTDGRPTRCPKAGRGAGDDRLLDLQPLPVRAGLA